MTTVCAGVTLALLAAAAPAQDIGRANTSAGSHGGDRQVCRWVQTRQHLFSRPVCRSVSEWRQRESRHPEDIVQGDPPRMQSHP